MSHRVRLSIIMAFAFMVVCANAYSIELSVSELSADPGSDITASISVDASAGIAGTDITLEYDPAILEYKATRITDLAKALGNPLVNAETAGTVKISIAALAGLGEGSGAIFEIDFAVKADATGTSALTISEAGFYDELASDIPVTIKNGSVTVKSAAPLAIAMSVSDLSADAGSDVTVSISVDAAAGIAGADITLGYDPAILEYKATRITDLAKALGTPLVNAETAGTVKISIAALTGLGEGSGAIFEIDFAVKADAKGTSALALSEVGVYDETANNILVTTKDGSVTVNPVGPTPEELLAMLEKSDEAVNTQNAAAFGDLDTDDVVFDYVSMPPPNVGKEATIAFMEVLFKRFPDAHVENIRPPLISGNIAVVEHLGTGTQLGEIDLGPLGKIPPTGKSFTIPHMDVIEFEGDKMKKVTTYDDAASLLIQLGIMPAPELPELVPSFTLPDPEPTGLAPMQAATEIISLWNAHDLNNVLKRCTSDVVFMFAALGAPLDRDAYVGLMESVYFTAFPDERQDIIRQVDMGNGWVMAEVVFKGTNNGPYLGIPATGKSAEAKGAWLMKFNSEGLLTDHYVYWDNLTVLMQLGLFPPPVDNTEANKAIQRQIFEEVWNNKNLDLINELCADDYVFRNYPSPPVIGQEGYKAAVAGFFEAFPDANWKIEDIIAEGDLVAIRVTGTGTHKGAFMGVPATDKPLTVTMNSIVRIVDGKIVESWNYADFLGLMQQIGALPDMGRTDFSWGEPSSVTGDAGDPEANKALAMRYTEEVWNQQKVDVTDELFAADLITHNPPFSSMYSFTDNESHKKAVTDILTAFPDFKVAINSQIAVDDKVFLHWTASGTHKAEVMGIKPTEKSVTWSGTTMYRVADGKIVETWWAWDALGLMQQLTAKEEPTKDYSNVFFLSLVKGLNMISVPLEPIEPFTARSLAENVGATVVIRYDEALQKFSGFALNAPGDGFAIEGGKGYIVNVTKASVVTFTGAAWTNEPAAAAPSADRATWAFVVSGSVLDGEDMSASDGSYTLNVKSLRTGTVVTEAVGASGYSIAAWADLNRKAVVEAGDRIEVSVTDSSGKLASGPFTYEIKLDEIRNAVMDVRLRLGDIIPEKSMLLQNFPNPFNPETWVPYQLKDASDVSIQIFSASGQLIRTIDLGYRSAGIYASKARAAYWDGKNEAGEEVASGIYFYSIDAGDFSATKKMVIKK